MKLDYNKNALDAFRLIATAQVFLGHVITHFGIASTTVVNAVYFLRGVPILFVLCGFLAAKSLEGRSPKQWLIGRAVRVIPGFWACILVNTVLILLVYETKPSVLEMGIYSVTQFFGMNFYTGSWLRGYGCGVPNGVLWTIPVQIQFFLLVPLIAGFLKKRKPAFAGILVLLLAFASILMEKAGAFLPEILSKLIGVTVLPYLYFLVAGMAAWYHRDLLIPLCRKYRWYLLLVYGAWKLAENNLAFPHLLDGMMYNTVTTLLVAALVFGFGFCGHWRMKRDLTYGFYLYHMVVINLVLHFGLNTAEPLWRFGLTVVLIAAVSVCCAWLSQRFVELPAGKLLRKKG
jgi:peptidoglycan/LPS O-acetylase OafA/YrhL